MKSTTSRILATGLALTLCSTATAADKAPERVVNGTTITSTRDPAVKITLPKSAQYVGAARWDLYGVADCEVQVFIEADEKKYVQRLYWVQFEGYLPDNTHQYKYPFTEKTTLGGREFDTRARFGPTGPAPKAGSDAERVMALIKEKGYLVGPESMNVRLVNMVDDTRRKELMIIYAEDLAPTGSTVEELNKPENKAKWEELKAELIQRARERIKLEF